MKEGEDVFIQRPGGTKIRAAAIVMAFDTDGKMDSVDGESIFVGGLTIFLSIRGFPPEDIIFDHNVFAIGTGLEEHNNYGVDFVEATRIIKKRCRCQYQRWCQ